MGAGSELDRWLPETPVHAYSDDVAAWHQVESQSTWWKARLAAAVDEQYGKLREYAAGVGVAYQARPESAPKSSGGGQDDSLIVAAEQKPRACARCGSTHAAAFPLYKRGLSICGQCYREAVGVSVFIEDAPEAVPA